MQGLPEDGRTLPKHVRAQEGMYEQKGINQMHLLVLL
jgi:hypothetical protein